MTNLKDINATVTARLTYEEDFTFRKRKEELALAARESVAPMVSELLEGVPCRVSIDGDGDIILACGDLFWVYVTSLGCTCSVSQIPFEDVPTSGVVLSLSRVVEAIHGLRSKHSKPISYGARIFTRTLSPTAPERLQLSCLSTSLSNLGKPTAFSCSYSYGIEPFNDTVDFEANLLEGSVRIARNGKGSRFPDFGQFWTEINLREMVDRITPFLDQLESSKGTTTLSNLLGRPPK